MKTFILAIFLAVITVAGSFLFNMQIDKTSHVMEAQEKAISQYIENEDYDSALSETEKLIEYIDKKRTALASTIDHKIIDDIELCVSEIRGCIEQKDADLTLINCRKLEHFIKHLPSNYSLTLQNIL